MEDLKICTHCGTNFSPNRSDQKFCSLKCKNKQNNKKVMAIYHQRKQEDIETRETHLVLIKNRDILKAYCNRQLSIDSLTKVGFILNCCTGFSQEGEYNSPLIFCYDYGYQFTDPLTVKIFKR